MVDDDNELLLGIGICIVATIIIINIWLWVIKKIMNL